MLNSIRKNFTARQPKEKKRKCEVVVEKTAKGVRRKLVGDCTPQELRALTGMPDESSD